MRSIDLIKVEIDLERHQLLHLSSNESATPEDSALLGETASIYRDGFSSETEQIHPPRLDDLLSAN